MLQKIDDKLDLTKVGMGAVRSKRFAMVVEDMKVIYIGVETQYVYLPFSYVLTPFLPYIRHNSNNSPPPPNAVSMLIVGYFAL